MAQRGIRTAAMLLGLLLGGAVTLSWAAAAGHHSEFSLTEEIFRWINFIVLAVILYVVISKFLPGVLANRRQQIERAITEAKASRAEAQRLLQENQRKTA